MSASEADNKRTAALKFFRILKFVATDRELSPEVVLHVTALLGGLLAHCSRYTVDDVATAMRGVVQDPVALEALHLSVRALGLDFPEDPGEPEPPPAA